MLKLFWLIVGFGVVFQPPSGGCVLKLQNFERDNDVFCQPPSGGCVLKQLQYQFRHQKGAQPPSGGCVLKLQGFDND